MNARPPSPTVPTSSAARAGSSLWQDRFSLRAIFVGLTGLLVLMQLVLIAIIALRVERLNALETEKGRVADIAFLAVKIRGEAVSTIQLDPTTSDTAKVFADAESGIAADRSAIEPLLSAGEAPLFARIVDQWTVYDRESRALLTLAKHDAKAANARLMPLYHRAYVPFDTSINEFVAARIAQRRDTMSLLAATQAGIIPRIVSTSLVGIVVFTLLLAGLSRMVLRRLKHLEDAAAALARGELDVDISSYGHEFGALAASFQRMVGHQRAAREAAVSNARVKAALDHVSTNAMIADQDDTIIYVNRSVVDMMTRNERAIQHELPDMRAAALLGSKIDVFHRRPEHQRSMLVHLSGTHYAEIELGGLTFALTANPVFDEHGTRLGTVVEWKDRTAEVAAENDVNAMVEAAIAGDFAKRMDPDGRSGFFRTLAERLNTLMQTADSGLGEVARVLGALAKGDLTQTISGDYAGTFARLKDDANRTVGSLTAIIAQITEAVDAVSTSAREIAAGNNDLSQRTEEQACSLEETASSMEELTSTVKQNAENAKQANGLAIGASEIAVRGGEVVGQVVATMASISESSKKIEDIISVIDGIAFQTSILALNATVEAARAGEQGRGFAVVAGEVRNLAQRSADAAKEIKVLTVDSVAKASAGQRHVDDAGKTMDEIVTAVKRVTDIMAEISAASIEQGAGIGQVNGAITAMDQVTQQNAALVEEVAAAAGSLQDVAQTLVSSMSAFTLETTVRTVGTPPPTRARARSGGPARPVAARGFRPTAAIAPSIEGDDWRSF